LSQHPASQAHRAPLRGRIAAAVLGTGLLMAGLVAWAGTSQLGEALRALSPDVLLLAFVLQLLLTVLAGLRVQLLLEGALGFADSLAVAAAHSACLMFAPLRTGELVYVYLAQRFAGRVPARGLSQLLVFRIFDVLAISMLTVLLLGWCGRHILPERAGAVTAVAGSSLLLLLVLAAGLVFRGKSLLGWLAARMAGLGRLGAWLARRLAEAGQELRLSWRQAAAQLVVGLGIWVLVFLSAWVVFVAMEVRLPLSQISLIMALQRYMVAIPVPALGTFGTTELTWVALVVPLGVPRDLALASIVVQHGLVGAYAVALGLVGGGWLWVRRG